MSRSRPDPNTLTPVPAGAFREACSHFATGVAVATVCASDGSPHGLTISSFVSVSLEPPLILICVDAASSVHTTFCASPVFAINVLSEEQRQLSIDFAAVPEGRFERVAWHSEETGAPVIAEVLAWFECRVVNRIEAGDHSILIGEVVGTGSRSGRPLLHFDRNYRELGN